MIPKSFLHHYEKPFGIRVKTHRGSFGISTDAHDIPSC